MSNMELRFDEHGRLILGSDQELNDLDLYVLTEAPETDDTHTDSKTVPAAMFIGVQLPNFAGNIARMDNCVVVKPDPPKFGKCELIRWRRELMPND